MIATFAALGVLAVIALGAALLLKGGNDKVTVPDLKGQPEAVARAQIQRAGLTPVLGDPVLNNTCEKGTVVEQNPPANSPLEKTRNVTIQVCGGKKEVTIPPGLKDSTFTNVKAQLEGLGLTVDDSQVDSGLPEGTVVEVDPKEGSQVAPGSTVKVKVSRGNVNEVPNVRGYTKDLAIQRLTDSGYKVRVRDGVEVPADQAGKVSDQNPKAGTKLARGKTVTIEVDIPEPTPTETPSGTPTTPDPSGSPTGGGGGGFPFPTSPPARLSTY